MIESDQQLSELWDQIMDNRSDLQKKVHRIRDKYFARWDETVIGEFLEWQKRENTTEPFYETDAQGESLSSRYCWPWAAFMHDMFGDARSGEKKDVAGNLVDELGKLWAQTENLISKILAAWREKNGLKFEKVENS